MPIVVVRLDTQEYGLPVYSVGEVLPMVAVRPLPEAPDLVEGVITVRGRTVPVVNLSRRLDHRPPPYALDTRLLVVMDGDEVMAIPVDEVMGVRHIPTGSLVRPPNLTRQSELLTGVAEMGHEQVLVLDPSALFTEEILFAYEGWDQEEPEAPTAAPQPAAPKHAAPDTVLPSAPDRPAPDTKRPTAPRHSTPDVPADATGSGDEPEPT